MKNGKFLETKHPDWDNIENIVMIVSLELLLCKVIETIFQRCFDMSFLFLSYPYISYDSLSLDVFVPDVVNKQIVPMPHVKPAVGNNRVSEVRPPAIG